MFVPVIDQNQKPLMPTTPSRARRWICLEKATGFFKKGVFCVRLNQKSSGRKRQKIAVGIDPGSKREAFTVKSKAHTYLNILVDAVDWVERNMKTRAEMRRGRRHRKTRHRQARFYNRRQPKIPPSTRARWCNKLRIINILRNMFYVSDYCVEDVKAKTKGKRKWDKMFSPLEIGKKYFYDELSQLGNLVTKAGYETKEFRDKLELRKSNKKLDDKFECHNVDSWVLANDIVGGHTKPDNKDIVKLVPLRFHRRQLHTLQCAKGGKRRIYGGTISLDLKRGSTVKHPKSGICYVGGTSNNRISLHSEKTGKRLCWNAKREDIKFLSFNSFRMKGII